MNLPTSVGGQECLLPALAILGEEESWNSDTFSGDIKIGLL